MRQTATIAIACLLLVACTTDFDRFKIGASGQRNGVTAGDGADGGGTSGNSGGTTAPKPAGASGEGGASGSAGETPTGGDSGEGMAGKGGDVAGTGGEPDCDSMTVYADGDGDGYGEPTSGRPGCEADGLVLRAGDCADDDDARNPDAGESCDTDYDDNCNDAANEGCTCMTGMSLPCGTSDGKGGFLDRGRCKVGMQACVDGKWSETCEGAEGPIVEECNDLDDDCDTRADEGLIFQRWVDNDGDTWGSAELDRGCVGESGVAYRGGDCNDENELTYPGAPERCGRSGPIAHDCDVNTPSFCPTHLPPTPAGCPALATGTPTLFGLGFRLWVGARNDTVPAPLLVFFFGTGGSPSQATLYIPKPADIADQGGIVIAPSESTMAGNVIYNGNWYTGDFDVIDKVIGCALEQLNIDLRRIYVSGFSAGGLMASVMAFQRSGYVAGVMSNSGGIADTSFVMPQNPLRLPAVVAMHGPKGTDTVIIDFADTSRLFTMEIAKGGGFAVDCGHTQGHAMAPMLMQEGAWDVMLDHRYGELPPIYTLPSEFDPDQCKVVEAP